MASLNRFLFPNLGKGEDQACEEFHPSWKCVRRRQAMASFVEGVPHEKAAPDAWINTRGLDRRIRT